MNVFLVFHHLQKDKQRKQRHSLKLDKKRRESYKHNYYIISPRVMIKAIIIIFRTITDAIDPTVTITEFLARLFQHTSKNPSDYLDITQIRNMSDTAKDPNDPGIGKGATTNTNTTTPLFSPPSTDLSLRMDWGDACSLAQKGHRITLGHLGQFDEFHCVGRMYQVFSRNNLCFFCHPFLPSFVGRDALQITKDPSLSFFFWFLVCNIFLSFFFFDDQTYSLNKAEGKHPISHL